MISSCFCDEDLSWSASRRIDGIRHIFSSLFSSYGLSFGGLQNSYFGPLLKQKQDFQCFFAPCEPEVADFAMFGPIVKTTWFFSQSTCFKPGLSTKPRGHWQLIHHRLLNAVLRPWDFRIASFWPGPELWTSQSNQAEDGRGSTVEYVEDHWSR